ncbi:hypothetical protein VB713_00025 [Anabaena cylindrica UHCC 0172]|uniref:hypothetical protein n=1 Tax=Anabaena cylindrica TaxID=1165 RepID=UPI002B20BCB3|nr:hypothetical protein [Anabaena cylindrica]MEA5549378.1 hypothetical protein [Anabaena cylindrica UHCC 0172]
MSKQILMIVANPSLSTTLGVPVGFWASELIHPYGQQVMPFRIEDEAKKLGADFITKEAFTPHAVKDGNLITGQQQNSGTETAKLVLNALSITGA